MLRSILVPLDGSVLAEQVLPLACGIARRSGARLDLVRVVPAPEEPVEVDGEWLSLDEQLAWMSNYAREYLDATRKRLIEEVSRAIPPELASGPFTVETRAIVGSAGPLIAQYAEEHHIDLIIMATHGRSGFSRWSLGSVADKVLQLSHAPVIAMRPATTRLVSLETLPALNRILVPLDGSSLSEQVLPLAMELARLYDGEIMLFRAAVPPVTFMPYSDVAYIPATTTGAVHEEISTYLRARAATIRNQGLRVRKLTSDRYPADGILNAADMHDVDLIAMTTHGRSGLSRVVFGSVADRVLREGHRPVLLVRPPRP